MDKSLSAFNRLIQIMDELREKCPWDKKQTMESLRHLTIEETYELSDAIIEKDWEELSGEVGDLFLHLVFYCKIASENDWFDVEKVLNKVCDKLIYRHPHIYADVKAESEEEVKNNWEKLKLKEKGKKSVLQGVPKSLPALVKATRIQSKVRGVGFDWDNANQVWDKVQEEMKELQDEVIKKSDKVEEEYGDLMFALVNYGRFININPEDAMEKANKKFMRRFNRIEILAKENKQSLTQLSIQEMESLWQTVKKEEKK